MLSKTDYAIADQQAEFARLDVAWQQVQEYLEAKKEQIGEEISQYPRPISACDAQFNGLLDERVAILQELGQVQGIRKQSLSASESRELLDAFLYSSCYMDHEVKSAI